MKKKKNVGRKEKHKITKPNPRVGKLRKEKERKPKRDFYGNPSPHMARLRLMNHKN